MSIEYKSPFHSFMPQYEADKMCEQVDNMINLSPEEFDRFIEECNKPPRHLSDKLKEAANLLNEEGLTFDVSRYIENRKK